MTESQGTVCPICYERATQSSFVLESRRHPQMKAETTVYQSWGLFLSENNL